MKFEHYLKRVEESEEFKEFKKEHKKSYLAAGFFVLDYETGKNMHQIYYCLPNGKIATFILEEGINLKISEQAIKKKLPKLKTEIKTDLDALKGIVQDEMKNRTVTENIKKIIAVLHILDNKTVWNLQCILDGLSLLSVHVDDSDKSVLKFEKHSLLDLIKSAPGFALPKEMPKEKLKSEGAGKAEQQEEKTEEQGESEEKAEKPSKEEVKEAEKIIESIKKQLKEEKEKIVKESKGRKKK